MDTFARFPIMIHMAFKSFHSGFEGYETLFEMVMVSVVVVFKDTFRPLIGNTQSRCLVIQVGY